MSDKTILDTIDSILNEEVLSDSSIIVELENIEKLLKAAKVKMDSLYRRDPTVKRLKHMWEASDALDLAWNKVGDSIYHDLKKKI